MPLAISYKDTLDAHHWLRPLAKRPKMSNIPREDLREQLVEESGRVLQTRVGLFSWITVAAAAGAQVWCPTR
ncbi:hypothetical protein CBM2633_A110069 [Cupriavidus taiwanensis]|nr:hypothetical protein CBM2633_A110069 [Cupriavidus taiwanensis]